MTCILAIEMVDDLNTIVYVPHEATKLGPTNSTMGLVAGESLPMIDLLYGLMLPSGNDAANAIAYYIAGGIDEFAVIMNEKAEEIGMTNTTFATPSGTYRNRATSTARDMARLAAYTGYNNEDVLSSILFLYCVNFAGNLSPRTNSERVCCCNRKAPGSSDATM